ncbi:MAG: DUF2232 domain-containing protein [Erysipelotrichaceae bacterium]|nr:DUF2232 domain-containing protein [Erysipelotrichaceae bacterium]
MNRKKTRKIVDGAMITSLFGALFLMDLYLGGIIGYFIYFVLPVFVVWYCYHYSLKDTFALSIAIVIVTFVVSSPINIVYAITALLVGMSVGYSLKKENKGSTIFMTTVAFTLISNILMYTVFSKLLEMDLIAEMTETFNTIQAMVPSFTTITLETFLKFIPLVVFSMAIIESYAMLILMMLILPRLKVPFKYQFNFLMMILPKWFGYISIITIILTPFFKEHLFLTYCSTIVFAIMVLQGVSVVALYFTVNKKTLLYILSILLVFVPYVAYVYLIIGFIDIFIGLKRIIMYNRFK